MLLDLVLQELQELEGVEVDAQVGHRVGGRLVGRPLEVGELGVADLEAAEHALHTALLEHHVEEPAVVGGVEEVEVGVVQQVAVVLQGEPLDDVLVLQEGQLHVPYDFRPDALREEV